jgi:hypothetical protein
MDENSTNIANIEGAKESETKLRNDAENLGIKIPDSPTVDPKKLLKKK